MNRKLLVDERIVRHLGQDYDTKDILVTAAGYFDVRKEVVNSELISMAKALGKAFGESDVTAYKAAIRFLNSKNRGIEASNESRREIFPSIERLIFDSQFVPHHIEFRGREAIEFFREGFEDIVEQYDKLLSDCKVDKRLLKASAYFGQSINDHIAYKKIVVRMPDDISSAFPAIDATSKDISELLSRMHFLYEIKKDQLVTGIKFPEGFYKALANTNLGKAYNFLQIEGGRLKQKYSREEITRFVGYRLDESVMDQLDRTSGDISDIEQGDIWTFDDISNDYLQAKRIIAAYAKIQAGSYVTLITKNPDIRDGILDLKRSGQIRYADITDTL